MVSPGWSRVSTGWKIGGLLVLLIVFLSLVVWLVAPEISLFFRVDQCLDRGGCWDELRGACRLYEPDALERCRDGKTR